MRLLRITLLLVLVIGLVSACTFQIDPDAVYPRPAPATYGQGLIDGCMAFIFILTEGGNRPPFEAAVAMCQDAATLAQDPTFSSIIDELHKMSAEAPLEVPRVVCGMGNCL